MEKRRDAPKVVNVAVWTVAVACAFVFALTVGIGLYNTVNSPISASEVAPIKSCKSGEALLAFNNYPTTYFKTIDPKTNKIYEHQPFEDAMDGTWRCSAYCVPIPAGANTATNDAKTQEALAKYLTGATTGGKPVIVAKTEAEFVSLLKSAPTNLENTVILTSTKAACQGYYKGVESKGASTDYKSLILKIDDKPVAVSPITTNNTVQEQQAKISQQKQADAAAEAARRSAAELQDSTEAGRTGKPIVAVEKGKASSSNSGTDLDPARTQGKSSGGTATTSHPAQRDSVYVATHQNFYNTVKVVGRSLIPVVGVVTAYKYRSDVANVAHDYVRFAGNTYSTIGRGMKGIVGTVGGLYSRAGKWIYNHL